MKKLIELLGALFVGVAGIACFLYFGGVRLNFLNFADLPITFGVGAVLALPALWFVVERRRALEAAS